MQHQPDTDAQMGDQAVAVTSTHSESQVTLWSNTFGEFPTDPANFRGTRITAEQRAEIVRHGPCQSTDILFSKNIDDDLEKNWSQISVGNSKKGIEKIRAHENTRLHCISLTQWKSF
eukprot:gene20592-22623_t